MGLKGTDGVVEEARAAGAEPVAPLRAARFAAAFVQRWKSDPSLFVNWVTCGEPMGVEALRSAGISRSDMEIAHRPATPTNSDDTRRAAEEMVSRRADLVLFCGGDGTARDVAAAVGNRVPILGIPSGVKMHSGVFAVTPEAGAEILAAYLHGSLRVGTAEILDLDEEAYRRGAWNVRLLGTAKVLVEPHLVQAGKWQVAEVGEASVRAELVEHFRELFSATRDALFLIGPGSTTASIAEGLGFEKTLLGVDAILDGQTIQKDVNEREILALLQRLPNAKIVVSPIGAQGFILGRGNLQLSPEVLRRIGTKNLIVVATPAKLEATPTLRVDTGDTALDEDFRRREYLFVVIGYRTTKLHPLQS